MKRFDLLAAVLMVVAFAAALPVRAQEWPAKPVRVVVPFPPGISDLIARLLAQRLAAKFGQPFIIDNRPGAAGNIGTDIVAKSAPDGYSFVYSSSGPLTSSKFLYKLPYDAVKDLTPVILVCEIPGVIAAHPSVPAKNLRELADLARARPGQLSIGSPGTATNTHLGIERFKRLANIDLLHVPYKGAMPSLTSVMAGTTHLSFALVPDYVQPILAGKIKGLAVSTRSRYPNLPDVPTAIEQGFDLAVSATFALMGPAGLPRSIVDKINHELNDYLKSPEGEAKLLQVGVRVIGGAPEDVTAWIESEWKIWKPIIDSAGVKLE